jgi:hypothetical protein
VLRNDGPTVRPTDLQTALATDVVSEPGRDPDVAPPALTTRVAQGEPVDGGLREALSGEVVPLVLDVDAEAA